MLDIEQSNQLTPQGPKASSEGAVQPHRLRWKPNTSRPAADVTNVESCFRSEPMPEWQWQDRNEINEAE
jgi:hypothetical protein